MQAYLKCSAFQRLYSVKSQLRQQLGSNYESQSPKYLPFLVVLATPFEAISTLHMYSLHCSLMYFLFSNSFFSPIPIAVVDLWHLGTLNSHNY